MGLKERIKSESRATRRITNNDLVCKDCVYKFDDSKKFGNTSRCQAFKWKPSNIVAGGNCPYRKTEHEQN